VPPGSGLPGAAFGLCRALAIGSCGVAKERMESKGDMTCHDWFFCTKKLSEQEVLGKVLKK